MEFQFSSVSDFMSMSGHGIYVWAAYGITFSAILALIVQVRIKRTDIDRKVHLAALKAGEENSSDSVNE